MLIGCKCSEKQLEIVGCECEIMVVRIQPVGYASDKDVSVEMAKGSEYGIEARRLHGPCARVYSATERKPRQASKFTEEYCRSISQNDNS